jgi:hypothetical protein
MTGRSPDQFRLSRLKEGERVCGGRGQFGNQPLWDSNTIWKIWIQHGTTELGKPDPARKSFRHRIERVSKEYVAGKSDIAAESGIRTHVERRRRSVRQFRQTLRTVKSCQGESVPPQAD